MELRSGERQWQAAKSKSRVVRSVFAALRRDESSGFMVRGIAIRRRSGNDSGLAGDKNDNRGEEGRPGVSLADR